MLTFRHKKRHARPANPQGKSVAEVPPGSYCSGCPHWTHNPLKTRQNDGYCRLLNVGDWMPGEGFGLLWDGIKICHIRTCSEDEEPCRPVRFVRRPRFDARWGGLRLLYARDAAWRPRWGHRPGWKKRSMWER